MRVFVTGASGFVGSAIVKELLQAGHQVLGLARSGSSAEALIKVGAAVHHGNLDDLQSLQAGCADCDAVIHTAFNHDFSKFKENCEADRQIILALGEALAGSGRPLVVTSGILLLHYDRTVTEEDTPSGSNVIPRAASEEAANAVEELGGKVYIVRLPPTTHGRGDHGFVPMVIGMARAQGVSAYIGAGENPWPAVHRNDAAAIYRMIVEQQPQQRAYHAVAEEGIAFKDIAITIGEGLQMPTVSKEDAAAEAHFGWFKHFASLGCTASAGQTCRTLGWEPKEAGLIEDLKTGGYFD